MLKRGHQAFVLVISILFVVFHTLLPVYAFLPSMRERAMHLALSIILVFVGAKGGKGGVRGVIDWLIIISGVGICAYVFASYFEIIEQYGTAEHWGQVAMGIVLVLIILEMARRAVRPTLPAIACLFLLYAIFGHHLPGQYSHPEYSLETIVSSLFLTTGGLWGQLLGVSSNIIAIFVFLGAFIVNTGGGTGFMKISTRIAGRFKGGPAKVATVSSALFGSISGSASANVASTGAFTIPMMKRLGYRPELAASVEAVASTGGQVMPPIMGAGAFVMAELVQVPYLHVAGAAFLPALLYFVAVIMGIHFYSGKMGYTGMDKDKLPGWRETGQASTFFLIPFAMLGYWLIQRYTPQYAAFWAFLTTLPLGFFNTEWRLDLKQLWPKYKKAILSGARQASVIAAICACAQIIISVIAMTGVGVKFTTSILSVTGGNLIFALILTGLTSILLGMEVPTTAAYIVAVVVGGPVLAELGVPLLAAHLFVFYLAILSAITPPICGAIFIAAGMAEANWVTTAKLGLKLAFAAFLLPFLFALDPSLVLIGPSWMILVSGLKGLLALTLLSAGIMGYLRSVLSPWQRTALLAAGCCFLLPPWWINLIGAGLAVWIYRQSQPQT
jgi:TRAP transporter 4TM/12TM fusion protein